MTHSADILKIARAHLGDKYVLGSAVPKNNSTWAGPWDCAEFASWCLYQAAGKLYGCDTRDPASAGAYTGWWARDAEALGIKVSIEKAASTAGAFLLRVPRSGATGHIALTDGKGGTVEAHSAKKGVIAGAIAGRRWDYGILIPGLSYKTGTAVPLPTKPVQVLRVTKPRMAGALVRDVQRALKKRGYMPGKVDGVYGPFTAAAVAAFQNSKGLAPDGEVGPITRKALGL